MIIFFFYNCLDYDNEVGHQISKDNELSIDNILIKSPLSLSASRESISSSAIISVLHKREICKTEKENDTNIQNGLTVLDTNTDAITEEQVGVTLEAEHNDGKNGFERINDRQTYAGLLGQHLQNQEQNVHNNDNNDENEEGEEDIIYGYTMRQINNYAIGDEHAMLGQR